MVHALSQAHRLLRPGGWLINLHDFPLPHPIEVHAEDGVIRAGWLTDQEDFVNELAGFNALAQVVGEGLFTLETEQAFDFEIHADQLPELLEWLEEWWETAVLPGDLVQRTEEQLALAGKAPKLILRVASRMTKLQKIESKSGRDSDD